MTADELPPEPGVPRSVLPRLAISAAIALLTFCVYAPVRHFGFVDYDDPDNITRSDHLVGGFTRPNVHAAMTQFVMGHWIPVSRFSYLLDAQLFSLRPGPMHVENVALHALTAVLLFLLLTDATDKTGCAAVIAGLFAVHPMHVESVAWLTERRDPLSTSLLLASIRAYVGYSRGRGWLYPASLVLFALSLASKSMGVTLPVLLVLLDFWPLRRRASWRMWRDKLPFFAIAAAASVVAVTAEKSAGAVANLTTLTLMQRADNAVVCYVLYILKLLIPTDLAVFYPHPGDWPAAQVAASLAAMAGLAVLAWRCRVRRPWVTVGLGWFFVTLLPVIGIGQLGAQSMADRYSYLPSVGLFIAIVFEARRWIRRRWIGVAAGGAVISGAALICRVQAGYWVDTTTLFRHSAAVTPDNPLVHLMLGQQALNRGDLREAADENRAALALQPNNAKALNNLGNCWAAGDPSVAIGYYEQAVAVDPRSAVYRTNLAEALHKTGRDEEAAAQLREAIRCDPAYGPARTGLAAVSGKRSTPEDPR